MPSQSPETVKELIELLKLFPPDHEVEFQGGLTLYRVKDRGVAHFEFNEMFEITDRPGEMFNGGDSGKN